MSQHPFTTFNFRIELRFSNGGPPICDAEFAECDGLELTLEPKTIREGGNNSRPIHLAGPVSYGQLTLKRGMTTDFGLWDWFESVLMTDGHGIRTSGEIAYKAADGNVRRAPMVLARTVHWRKRVETTSRRPEGPLPLVLMSAVAALFAVLIAVYVYYRTRRRGRTDAASPQALRALEDVETTPDMGEILRQSANRQGPNER